MADTEENSFPLAVEMQSKPRLSISKTPSKKFVPPTFKEARKHFHDTLPKRIKDTSSAIARNRLALPGEHGTEEDPIRLWNPWTSTPKDLDAFG